jgi:hypothetical protein
VTVRDEAAHVANRPRRARERRMRRARLAQAVCLALAYALAVATVWEFALDAVRSAPIGTEKGGVQ